MSAQIDIDQTSQAAPGRLDRRTLLRAGATGLVGGLVGACSSTGVDPIVPVGAALLGEPRHTMPTPAQFHFAPVADVMDKPTVVAQSRDPLGYSIADNLFWNDILMEHATFFTLLMPGPELAGPRQQAEQFQAAFQQQLARSRAIDAGNFRAFNQTSIDLARRFVAYKREMQMRQTAGQLKSLVWPLFFHHTAREAERFAARLAIYSSGQIEYEQDEVVEFWSDTMGEHAAFIAHLLDPQEGKLIGQARQLQAAFLSPGPARRTRGANAPVMQKAQQILQFKVAGEQGIRSGAIKSIIPPALAAHVRREAERFIDELRRAV